MSDANVGIDVSHYQNDAECAGEWLFVVHAVGDGLQFADPEFPRRFPTTGGLRGAYLYARPWESDGRTQANHFCDLALVAGFKKDVDLWQLDAEDGENAGVNNGTWRQFITDFMWQAFARLGKRGFLYAGWPFLEAHGITDLVKTFQWWLPDYGPNDGQVHPPQTPADVTPYVVLHQYTSAGNLDQNVVASQDRWNALIHSAPPIDWVALEVLQDFRESLPVYQYESGWTVVALKRFLNQIHEGPGNEDPFYGDNLEQCVKLFKVKHNVGNDDGTVFGTGACAILFKLL